MGVYERYLSVRIRRAEADHPETVAVVLTERDLLEQGAYGRLERFLRWTFEYGAERVLIYVSVLDDRVIPTLEHELETLDTPAPIALRSPTEADPAEGRIQASIGLGGKHEFTQAVRSLAERTKSGEIAPEEITAEDLESELVFPAEPDLVIKTGAERLSDFLIWQSVYAELYFTDVNWRNFRKRDYLRAVLDYLDRQRRFGR